MRSLFSDEASKRPAPAPNLFALGAMLCLCVACGDGIPDFDVQTPAPECAVGSADGGTAAIACPEGQRCLSGRCFADCDDDAQCSSREMCVDGLCVTREGPRPDAGIPDLGMPDVSACVDGCDGGVCDEERGECVACLGEDECGGMTSICDFAYRTCVMFAPGICPACNDNLDCAEGTECIGDGVERVCLMPCETAEECGPSFECQDAYCRPQIGTCTQIRNAIARTPCVADTDCVPIGSTPGPGTCSAEGVCQAVCDTTVGMEIMCPVAELTCPAGPDAFCMGPPMM